ncbi:MAG: hypothetical protein K0Q61_754, partial [Rhodococcus erythropolis]|nr:hypothetical protein [Rhodococcus erythropolis]
CLETAREFDLGTEFGASGCAPLTRAGTQAVDGAGSWRTTR